ncbi:MAG TPA: F0F1 ATP synthase subunit A [Acidimicrobiales bacterium]|nr:F0F1 ATP synthase subunit A [Acidimicrobiales bacterium]
MILGLEFPPISHVIEWPTLFGGDVFGVNKVVLLMWLSVALVFGLFYVATREPKLVPTGAQNVAESTVEFVDEQIILQTIGPDGRGYLPFLLTLFTFIFVCNIWELIPAVQMPVNARMALPMFMAIVVWFVYIITGIRHQGFFGYFKNSAIPPGVPKAILPLVAFIELLGILITRPFALAVRLFANMLAGHLLLVTFAVITQALFASTILGGALPLALLIFLMGFELLVAFLQAYIFTILAAVYIDSSMHPEH